MSYVFNDSDSDDISEVECSIQVRPYMYEPTISEEINSKNSNLSSESSDTESETGGNLPDTDSLEWCACGNCSVMSTARECKCCIQTNIVDAKIEAAGIQCITEHEGFVVNCLNIHVLETSYYEYIQDNGPMEQIQQIHQLYRHIAYRRFARWIWKILGKKSRRVLPSCVVCAIRSRFPSENYCGFKYPQ